MEILHAQVIGAGKPFIILHGFLGMGDNWKNVLRVACPGIIPWGGDFLN